MNVKGISEIYKNGKEILFTVLCPVIFETLPVE